MCQLCWFILFSHCNTQRSIINPAHMFDIKHDKRIYLLTEMFLQKVQILWYFIRSQQTAKVWIFLISTILFIITPTRRTLETDETRELFVGEMRVRCQVSATGECKLSWEWHCDTDIALSSLTTNILSISRFCLYNNSSQTVRLRSCHCTWYQDPGCVLGLCHC